MNANDMLVAPPPTRRTAVGGYPVVIFSEMLGMQLHPRHPVKLGALVFMLLLLWLPLLFLEIEAWHEAIFQIYAANLIKLG